MSDNSISRVQYYERQFLRTQDFSDEQAYHVAMRRRHLIAHHSWGIVAGLELTVDPDNAISVSPGMAIDGYGRELILPVRQPLPTAAFDERDSDLLGVWLIYDRLDSDAAPAGYNGCGPDGSAQSYRWRELARVRMDIVDPSRTDMRQPLSVPVGDLAPDPTRTPPDDPEDDWPVFLGELRRTRANPQEPYSYALVQGEAARPYAGLVGAEIVAPSGRARLQLGAAGPEDPLRFALFINDPQDPAAQPPSLSPLAVDHAGTTHLGGHTTVYDRLTMDGGPIAFGANSTPDAAHPWQIYRHVATTPAVDGAAIDGAAAASVTHELRVELAGRGQGQNKVVIGAWSAEEKAFKPCLSVADDCQVTVHGNLVIQGKLTEEQTRPAPQLSPQYRALALSASISAINNAIREQVFSSADARAVLDSAEGRRVLIDLLLGEVALLREIANRLAGNPTGLSVLAQSVLNSEPDGRAAVATLLAGNTEWLRQVTERFVASPAGRQVLIDNLLASAEAREAIIRLLLDSGPGRTSLVNGLLETADGRSAIVIGLLNRDSGRESLVSFLTSDDGATALQAILRGILPNDGARDATVRQLVTTPEGRAAMVGQVIGTDSGRETLITLLLDPNAANQAALGLILRSLVNRPEGQQAFIQALLASDPALTAILNGLGGNESARNRLIELLLINPTTRGAVFNAIWQDNNARDALITFLFAESRFTTLVAQALPRPDGARSIALALQGATDTQFSQLRTLLREAEFSALADRLREALPPETP
jgi:hypothetical protein